MAKDVICINSRHSNSGESYMQEYEKIINDLEGENLIGARDAIRSVLNQKVAEKLDAQKPEVASNIGNDEVNEATDSAAQALDPRDEAVIRAFLKQRPLKGVNLISTNKKTKDFDQETFRLDDRTGDDGIVSWYHTDDGELKVALGDIGWMVKATPTTVLAQQTVLTTANRRDIGYKASGVEKELGRYLKKWEKD